MNKQSLRIIELPLACRNTRIYYTMDEQLPSPDFLARMLQWLCQLMDTYKDVENRIPSGHTHQRLLTRLILDTCIRAAYNVRKTEVAVRQYNVLTRKLDAFGGPDGTHKLVLYSTAWNRQQVYSGVREMYTEYLWKCSEVMVESCATLKTLNEQYIKHYS